MAEFNATQAGTLSPEDYAQQQQINRNQRMADLLTQQGMQQMPAGSMVSGRYVPTSPFQQLAQIANVAAGQYLGKKGDEEAIKLAEKIRNQYTSELNKYQQLRQGTPAQEGGIQGPNGMTTQTTPDMYNADMSLNPQYKQVAPVAAQAPNPQAANMYGASVATNPAIKQYATKQLFETPKWNEITKYNEKTGNTDNYVYDQNSPNPESTMRFVSTSKPAITLNERLSLQDRGINVPTGGSMPAGNQVGGQSNVVGGQPNAMQPTAVVKPVTATNAPVNDLVKTYGYDPFKPPPTPAQPSPQAAREWQSGLSKPLDGTAANTVTGATTYVDALGKYNDYVSGLSASQLANPQVRSRLNSLYAQVKLTGKEANNLGVLNGGDERILEEVVPNYSNILVTKNTVKKILDEQKEFGSSKIVATYRTAQKPVPENMRKYVVVPKVEEVPTGAPKQTGATEKAILNGEQIEVRNGKWVNSKTGQEVK